ELDLPDGAVPVEATATRPARRAVRRGGGLRKPPHGGEPELLGGRARGLDELLRARCIVGAARRAQQARVGELRAGTPLPRPRARLEEERVLVVPPRRD